MLKLEGYDSNHKAHGQKLMKDKVNKNTFHYFDIKKRTQKQKQDKINGVTYLMN